jgi:hypothetical protein
MDTDGGRIFSVMSLNPYFGSLVCHTEPELEEEQLTLAAKIPVLKEMVCFYFESCWKAC